MLPAETPLIGKVNPGTPAAQAGLRVGDRILKMNGRPIYFLNDLSTIAAEHPGAPAQFTIARPAPGKGSFEIFETAPMAAHAAIVEAVIKDGPAERAGLLPLDRVTSLNGQPFVSATKFTELVQQNGAKPLTLEVQRDKQDFIPDHDAGSARGRNRTPYRRALGRR